MTCRSQGKALLTPPSPPARPRPRCIPRICPGDGEALVPGAFVRSGIRPRESFQGRNTRLPSREVGSDRPTSAQPLPTVQGTWPRLFPSWQAGSEADLYPLADRDQTSHCGRRLPVAPSIGSSPRDIRMERRCDLPSTAGEETKITVGCRSRQGSRLHYRLQSDLPRASSLTIARWLSSLVPPPRPQSVRRLVEKLGAAIFEPRNSGSS